MKVGAYICTTSGGFLAVHSSPRQIFVGDVDRITVHDVVRVLDEGEHLQKKTTASFEVDWWWVQVMTMRGKRGYVVFNFGPEKRSHFEYCGP